MKIKVTVEVVREIPDDVLAKQAEECDCDVPGYAEGCKESFREEVEEVLADMQGIVSVDAKIVRPKPKDADQEDAEAVADKVMKEARKFSDPKGTFADQQGTFAAPAVMG